jgi:hypothetical protein
VALLSSLVLRRWGGDEGLVFQGLEVSMGFLEEERDFDVMVASNNNCIEVFFKEENNCHVFSYTSAQSHCRTTS